MSEHKRILIQNVELAPNRPYPNRIDGGKFESLISVREKTFVHRKDGSEMDSFNIIFPYMDFLVLDENNKNLRPV